MVLAVVPAFGDSPATIHFNDGYCYIEFKFKVFPCVCYRVIYFVVLVRDFDVYFQIFQDVAAVVMHCAAVYTLIVV